MKKYLLLPVLLCTITAFAQKISNPDKFAKTITAADLRKHLSIVAGPEMEGRETGTVGQRKAAAYIEQQFRNMGLTPGNNGSFQMEYPLYQDTLIDASIEVNDKKFTVNKDFLINLATNAPATYRFSEIVFMGEGINDSSRNDYKGVNVRGKLVMVFGNIGPKSGLQPNNSVNNKITAATRNGAAAILVINTTNSQMGMMRKGRLFVNPFRRSVVIQQYFISPDIAKAIMGEDFTTAINNNSIKAKTYNANVLLDFKKELIKTVSSNVVAVLEGSDKKDEYVFLTAHYDHLGKRDSVIYYGADDDGSGTVSVLEMAEAFVKAKAAGKGPRRSIVFMTVSGEEKGLLGSEYYSEHPLFPLDKTSVDLNTDMVGRIGIEYRNEKDSMNYVYLIGDDKLSSDLTGIADKANKKFKLKIDRKYNDLNDPNRFYFRSDHYNFAKKGIPILFYSDGVHADYHKPTDTVDKINFGLMENRVRYIFSTAWEIANRDDMLKRDIPLPVMER
ncbi:hypothetical protein BH09BAC2_BH09BAC2_02470 [soil metagenome]